MIAQIINALEIKKSVESSFKICEIKRAKESFSELSRDDFPLDKNMHLV